MTSNKKPGPTAKRRAAKKRKDDIYAKAIRAEVADRDEVCRCAILGGCAGPLEWAHLHGHQRSETRGLPPEERHTTDHSLMLCSRHHRAYDQHLLNLLICSPDGANGPLVIVTTGIRWQEPE